MEVAHGRVTDRPFARTIYMIAAQRFTGDLILRDGERRYKVCWEDGRIVAAESPAPADNAGRVALAAGLVTSTDVSAVLERMARAPGADVVPILAELARLKPEQVALLKRRLLAQRAARAFALPEAAYVLDSARSLRADPEVPPLDARWLVYFGVRTHYTVDRLERELGGLLDRGIKLALDATPALPVFAFGEGEQVVMDRLAQRAWTPRQLLGACVGVEGRLVLSVLYALVACDCLEPGAVTAPTGPIARGTETQVPPPIADAAAEVGPRRPRPPSSPAPAVPGAAEHSRLSHGTVRRLLFPGHGTVPPPSPDALADARSRRSKTRPPVPEVEAAEPNGTSSFPPVGSAGSTEIRRMIADKIAALDRGADHYALLGVSQSARADEIRTAYFGIARRIHPDRLRAVGVFDVDSDAQRVFARINQAFGVLSDPQRRAEYSVTLSAGGEEKVRKAHADAEEKASRVLRAEETFRRGEMALRRSMFEQARALFEEAVALNHEEAEYHALLAWAVWLSTPDKAGAADKVARRLGHALALSPQCVPAHFYGGQIAKQSGQIQAAIDAFRRVTEIEPGHPDANLELRVLLGRLRKK